MNRKPAAVASAAIVVAMFIMSAWAWTQLPPGARVPVHWGANGAPDRSAEPLQAMLQLPLVGCAVTLLFALLPRLAAGQTGHMRLGALSPETFFTIWSGVWMTSMLAIGGNHAATILTAAGSGPTRIIQIEIGLLLVILGAYHLGTVRRTSLLGVRTPWTVASERSWNGSQQLAGQSFVALGLVVVSLALLGNAMLLMGGFVGSLGLFLVVLMMYSYRLWKMDPQRGAVQE